MNMMNTKIERVNPEQIDETIMEEAGRLIAEGELVAFPTETVYGYVPVTLVEQIIEKHGGWFDARIPFA